MTSPADLLTALVVSVAVSMMASTAVACGGDCSTQQAGVTVSFPADVLITDVAVITATGACGPAPVASSLCQTLACDAGGDHTWADTAVDVTFGGGDGGSDAD